MANRTESRGPRRGTVAVAHAIEAAVRTELACVAGLWGPGPATAAPNAFGEVPRRLGEDPRDAAAALATCAEVVAHGGRAAAVVSLASLVDARRRLLDLVDRRVPLVIHAVATLRGERPSVSAHADLHALGDIGVAVLAARDAQDAADLTIVAHRAAEDAETPVVILHDGWPASWARDRIVLPDVPLVRATLEPGPAPLAAGEQPAAPHRRAAARIPFALSSAMRAFERHAARKLHAVDSAFTEGAEVVLVASGAIAESARATVEHQRSVGSEPHLGLVQVLVLRPFPGAEIVRAVGRARGVAVIERADSPLAQSNPLATEVKAAFADALTWAPGYPGIGRIPTVFSACIDPAGREASPGDLLAVVENALQGEQGRRAFRVARDGERGPDVVPAASERRVLPESFTVRWAGEPTLPIDLLIDLYGGQVRATPLYVGVEDDVFDITFARSVVRAHHGASELDLLVLDGQVFQDEGRVLEAVGALRDGGAVIVTHEPSAAVRAGLRARGARLFLVEPKGGAEERAGQLAGAILRAAPPPALDRAQLLADAERALRGGSVAAGEGAIRALLDAVTRGLDTAAELPSS